MFIMMVQHKLSVIIILITGVVIFVKFHLRRLITYELTFTALFQNCCVLKVHLADSFYRGFSESFKNHYIHCT